MGKLFGTDGVRGSANNELTPELAFKLGKAGAYVLTKTGGYSPKIIVGRDTRLSGNMLEAALTAGMCSVGATVYTAGVAPTPAVAHLARGPGFDAGVMISASHNPFYDNGIKFFNHEGYKLADSIEDEIEWVMETGLDSLPRPTGDRVGSVEVCPGALSEYIGFIMAAVPGLDLNGMKLALDCANGAAYTAAPEIFRRLGANVHVLHDKPDGVNINDDCGSTHLESLRRYVRDNGMAAGAAFDGDGDRCLLVGAGGEVLDGDRIMSICGIFMRERGTLAKNTLVATVMSNMGLSIMGQERGITVERAGVGDRYVLEMMLKHGYNLGGEQSGHVIFLDHSPTGDGILTAVKTLSFAMEKGLSLEEAAGDMDVLPQTLVNVRVQGDRRLRYMENGAIRRAIEEIEEKLNGMGRVLIRPSGTEPLIRIMLEGPDKGAIDREARRLADIMTEELR